MGAIGFSEPEGWPGLELAWLLARRWWGFGYATEGARAALEHSFIRWKRDRVISLISPEPGTTGTAGTTGTTGT